MATLSDLIAWRDALLKSRLSGIQEVRDSNGERVVYRSDREMAAALAAAESAIDAVHRGAPISTIQFRTSKGL